MKTPSHRSKKLREHQVGQIFPKCADRHIMFKLKKTTDKKKVLKEAKRVKKPYLCVCV